VCEQRRDAVADEVRRGLEPGREEQDRGADALLVV
jgi:hypothetical protein